MLVYLKDAIIVKKKKESCWSVGAIKQTFQTSYTKLRK